MPLKLLNELGKTTSTLAIEYLIFGELEQGLRKLAKRLGLTTENVGNPRYRPSSRMSYQRKQHGLCRQNLVP